MNKKIKQQVGILVLQFLISTTEISFVCLHFSTANQSGVGLFQRASLC